jgi:hypothetical protein
MAHYAFLDENDIVVQVIVGKDENEPDNNGNLVDWEEFYGDFAGFRCKRTSYNTLAGIHVGDGIPFRKNYASIGFKYDSSRDAFIPPKPEFPSWVLNEETCTWQAPVPMPVIPAEERRKYTYSWDEENLAWVKIDF